jgi:hypothetical protein
MFGIDDLAIAGLIASLAGTAISYNSQQQAAKRAQSESLAAMRRQQQYQRQAEQTALDRAQDYKTDDRLEEQHALQNEMEQSYLAPTLSAQSINANAATTQGDVSGDYQAAKARSDANVENLAKTFANLMARSNAAKQLRLNEGYRNADAASTIGRLQNFSQGQDAVDRMRIADAANSGATGQFLGDLVGTLGSAGMLYGANAAKPVTGGVNAALDSAKNNLAQGYIGSMRGLL